MWTQALTCWRGWLIRSQLHYKPGFPPILETVLCSKKIEKWLATNPITVFLICLRLRPPRAPTVIQKPLMILSVMQVMDLNCIPQKKPSCIFSLTWEWMCTHGAVATLLDAEARFGTGFVWLWTEYRGLFSGSVFDVSGFWGGWAAAAGLALAERTGETPVTLATCCSGTRPFRAISKNTGVDHFTGAKKTNWRVFHFPLCSFNQK